MFETEDTAAMPFHGRHARACPAVPHLDRIIARACNKVACLPQVEFAVDAAAVHAVSVSAEPRYAWAKRRLSVKAHWSGSGRIPSPLQLPSRHVERLPMCILQGVGRQVSCEYRCIRAGGRKQLRPQLPTRLGIKHRAPDARVRGEAMPVFTDARRFEHIVVAREKG